MKKLIYIFFFTYTFSCSGQYSELKSTLNQVLIEIDTLQKRMDRAEKHIKAFRKVSNKWADSVEIASEDYILRFERLEDSLAKDQDFLILKKFDEELLKVYFKDENISNPPESIEESVKIIQRLKNEKEIIYEPLAFEVSFQQELDKIRAMILAVKSIDSLPESVQDNALERLFNAVDNQAKSVGKRMGRMIQHSITEYDNYVTNTSLTRLNMAMTGYLIAKQNLELEIYSIIQISNQKPAVINLECNCADSIIQPKPRLQFDTGMFFPIIMADTRQSLGFGMVYT
ncbi:MAG: hypothetical protein N4A46_13560, partial [Schleiferiaceae bacterium]|nr:hypothetical protein [Schleiferiaceae bacterium]